MLVSNSNTEHSREMASRQKRRKTEHKPAAELGQLPSSIIQSLFDYWLLGDMQVLRFVSRGWRSGVRAYWKQLIPNTHWATDLVFSEEDTEESDNDEEKKKPKSAARAKVLTLYSRLVPKAVLNAKQNWIRSTHFNYNVCLCNSISVWNDDFSVDEKFPITVPVGLFQSEPVVVRHKATNALVMEESAWIREYVEEGRVRCPCCKEPYDDDNKPMSCDYCLYRNSDTLIVHRACSKCMTRLWTLDNPQISSCVSETDCAKRSIICDACEKEYTCYSCKKVTCPDCSINCCYATEHMMCRSCEVLRRNDRTLSCIGGCGEVICHFDCLEEVDFDDEVTDWCWNCRHWTCGCVALVCDPNCES